MRKDPRIGRMSWVNGTVLGEDGVRWKEGISCVAGQLSRAGEGRLGICFFLIFSDPQLP